MVFDRHDHVGERRGAAGTGDVEQVRKARRHQAQVVQRPAAPFVLDAQAAAATQVELHQGAGHGVEAGGQHQRVECELPAARTQPAGGDGGDALFAHVDQAHIRPVEAGVVAAVHAQALARDRLLRAQQRSGGRVAHGLADLAAHELGRQCVGAQVGQQVGIGAQQAEAADAPAFFEQGLARRRQGRQRRLGAHRQFAAEAAAHAPVAGAKAGVVGLDARFSLGVLRAVVGRHRVRGGALEHRQRLGLLCDQRDHLHRRRAGADHGHAAAAEIDRLMRPGRRMQHRPGKSIEAGKRRHVGG